MNKVLYFVIALFLVMGVLCGCASDTNAPSESSSPKETTETADYSSYDDYEYLNMTFKAPGDWDESENDYGMYLYSGFDYLFITSSDISDVDVDVKNINGVQALPEESYKGLLDGILSEFNTGYNIIFEDEVIVHNFLFKRYEIKGVLSGNRVYLISYFVYSNKEIFLFNFVSRGEKECNSFENAENAVIQSITFNASENTTDSKSETNGSYAEHSYLNLTFEAPDDWKSLESNETYYLYNDPNLIYINAIDMALYGVEPIVLNGFELVPKNYYDTTVETMLSRFDSDEKITKSDELIVNERLFKHYIVSGNLANKKTEISAYFVYDNGYLYCLYFSYNLDDSVFDDKAETDLINSIEFNK